MSEAINLDELLQRLAALKADNALLRAQNPRLDKGASTAGKTQTKYPSPEHCVPLAAWSVTRRDFLLCQQRRALPAATIELLERLVVRRHRRNPREFLASTHGRVMHWARFSGKLMTCPSMRPHR